MQKRLTSIALVVLLGVLGLWASPQRAEAQDTINDFWVAEYYNNSFLIGPAVISRVDRAIQFNWGTGAPGEGLSADNFSVRWGTSGFLPAGVYRFIITADDGFQLWVDGVLQLNTFNEPRPGQTLGVDVTLEAGHHTLQIDYVDYANEAYIFVDWGPASGIANPSEPLDNSQALAVVEVTTLNVRTGPSLQSPILTRIRFSEAYNITGRSTDGNWWQILVNGQAGWVSAALIDARNATNVPTINFESEAPTFSPALTGQTLRTTANLLMRSGPTTAFRNIGRIPAGQTAEIIGRNSLATWYYVRFGETIGWVSGAFVLLPDGLDPNSLPVQPV